jgi:hypothetical protein
MRAYGRQGLAVCFVKWDDGWRVMVGARTEALLQGLVNELGLEIDDW